MTKPARHMVYRACINLYPPTFRRHYREDLVQHFDDLVVDRGPRVASFRTALDLAVTVPTYRLERIMSQQHSATTLAVTICLVAAGGVFGLLTDIYPGVVLLLAAAVLGVVQRSTLARAIRTPVAGLRSRRLRISAVLAVMFVVAYAVFLMTIGDSWSIRATILTVVGTTAMIGALIYFVVGLLTPKADPHLVN